MTCANDGAVVVDIDCERSAAAPNRLIRALDVRLQAEVPSVTPTKPTASSQQGGAPSPIGCALLLQASTASGCVLPATPAILPDLLIAHAQLVTAPEPRSRMLPSDQTNACQVPSPVWLQPTT